jgi:large subunit ribosomal protein L17
MYRNLVTDLLKHEKITTTLAKAKEARSLAEKMITLGKEGSLASRRRALAFIYDPAVVEKVFSEYTPRYKSRAGGYTRVLKLGQREGDRAPMARIEMVE